MTLDLHEDSLILCKCSLSARHPLSQCCMGSHKGCQSDREGADCIHDGQGVPSNIVICCDSGAEVLRPTTYARAVVLGAEGSRGVDDAGAVGNGAGTEDAGTYCSSVCTAGSGYSSVGRSATRWSSSGSGGER